MANDQSSQFYSCSLPIRQTITTAQKRFQICLSELQNTNLTFTVDTDVTKQAQNLAHSETLSFTIDNFMKRIKSTVDTLTEQNKEWFVLLRQLSMEHLALETKIYEQWTMKNDNFLENISRGLDVLSNLETKLNEVKDSIFRIRGTVAQPVNNLPMNSFPMVSTAVQNVELNVHLPKLQLPLYYGDPLKWTEYWDSFESSVHSQNISSVQKFNYLISTLRGTAYKAIEGISVTNSNYQIALDILKKRFGDPNVIKRYLYSDLRKIPSSSNKTTDLRYCLESVERICRQLGSIGEDLNQPTLIMLILEKLPGNILIELGKLRTPADSWKMDKLLKCLHEIISIKEEAYQISVCCNLRDNEHRTPRQNNQTQAQPTTDAFPIFASNNRNQTRARIVCAFCFGSHYSDQCLTYDSMDSRKAKIQELKLCYRCLRTGHLSSTCQAIRPCFYCRGNHNRAMCSKNIELTSQQPKISIETTKTTDIHFIAENSFREPEIPSSNELSHENSQLSDEQVTFRIANNVVDHNNSKNTVISLMIAKVLVMNMNEEQRNSKEVFAFFDTGSQKTYITSALASELKLESLNKDLLAVSTFASKTPHYIHSHGVQFGMLLNKDTVKHINAFTTQILTQTMLLSNLKVEDVWELELNDYTKDIPQHFLSRNKVKPDILIGMDYFWDFIDSGNIFPLPSGLYAIPSTVGMLFSGKQAIWNSSHTNSTSFMITDNPDGHTSEFGVENLEQFWNLETVGIKDNPEVTDDDMALEKFNKTIYFLDNRYHVQWPWKSEQVDLKDNYGLCFGRLNSLLKRFAQLVYGLVQALCHWFIC